MNTNNNTEDTFYTSKKKTEGLNHPEYMMFWNNDETNWDSAKRYTCEGKITDELANIDLTAYYENAVLVER